MNEDLLKIRHSASHVLATAVLRLFPDAKLDIGPATENVLIWSTSSQAKTSQKSRPR